ncbi:uncharacterized protein PHALS_02796 [Plasmopara halstedii]|uniref:Uncharacterized protein n=1 Tax=Plasmopara halstedii TaxID=4781 RepID=A0A0P1AY06_PLAHL|nr:uncharacterized protein PHALS_02796 [Plasmopara halstedii]CEG46393.1 hypothetical protein PHALS_02796 [Plasmopara halstedii]|eukprot:XP_024582762.1 hypothetical protein PHALS_02796 [Plasmopara halstedii]
MDSTLSSSNLFAKDTPRRIANWDNKREKCNNCDLIYLKTLSQHTGFCSVDCKSNLAYLEKVNRSIRAVKEAIHERQRMQNSRQEPQPIVKKQHSNAFYRVAVATGDGLKNAQSFAEFELDARAVNLRNCDWSISAAH